jgi:hypothetical protein
VLIASPLASMTTGSTTAGAGSRRPWRSMRVRYMAPNTARKVASDHTMIQLRGTEPVGAGVMGRTAMPGSVTRPRVAWPGARGAQAGELQHMGPHLDAITVVELLAGDAAAVEHRAVAALQILHPKALGVAIEAQVLAAGGDVQHHDIIVISPPEEGEGPLRYQALPT